MKASFKSQLNALTEVIPHFDAKSVKSKLELLKELSKSKLPLDDQLIKYYHALVFQMAYPVNASHKDMAYSELTRINSFLKKQSKGLNKFINTGLPYTKIHSNFSHHLVRWLIHEDFDVVLEDYDKKAETLVQFLEFTLPDLERELALIAENNQELIDLLGLKPKSLLDFLLSEFLRLERMPRLKDYLFDSLELKFTITIANPDQAIAHNRLGVDTYYYQSEANNSFKFDQILEDALPEPEFLSLDLKLQISRIAKLKLFYLQRETEPSTYMDQESIRYYQLEKGISVALFTMNYDRQLPIESYVGYTLYKNGYPVAYGGAWIFGRRAMFGINIFEWFRGAESGLILAQLLRVYRQVFQIDYFEVEPYQYGLDNPEGIESGAFWFYYKFGFRPVDSQIEKLAAAEYAKILKSKTYRSSKNTLSKFTESNIALNLGKKIPPELWQIREKVTAFINKNYEGNRYKAERFCIQAFLHKTGFRKPATPEFRFVLADVALMFEAMNWNEPDKVYHLKEMILKKPKDLYRYQEELLKLLS